jgi:hypothetical protein
MGQHCHGCGRSDVETFAYRCTWPDGATTIEHHCSGCLVAWQPQLLSVGATLRSMTDAAVRADGPAIAESAIVGFTRGYARDLIPMFAGHAFAVLPFPKS